MSQPEIHYIPYLRMKHRGYRAIVAIERGYGAEFVNLSVHLEKDIDKLESFPLLSEVVVNIVHSGNGKQILTDIAEGGYDIVS